MGAERMGGNNQASKNLGFEQRLRSQKIRQDYSQLGSETP